MAIEVTSQVIDALLAAAEQAYPREACGILLGQTDNAATRITQFTPAANVHPTPRTHFEIDPQALIDAHRAEREGGAQLVGYFHSHPNGPAEPSRTDRAMASGDGRIWAIVGGEKGGICEPQNERDDQGYTLADLGDTLGGVKGDTLRSKGDTLTPKGDTFVPSAVTFWRDGGQGFTPLSYSLAKG